MWRHVPLAGINIGFTSSLSPMKFRIRYSLRTLLIFTTIVAVISAMPIRQAYEQRKAREWVAGQGGHITFAREYNATTQTYDHQAELKVPMFLVSLFGIDAFDSVIGVILDREIVHDLQPLANLSDLRSLAIMIEIDDALDFSPLAKLNSLESLTLGYTNITPKRLEKVRKLLPGVRVREYIHP